MIIRTHPINQVPDVEKIKDELVKQFSRDFSDVFIKTIRNIFDDVTALEKTERVSALPTASLEYRGKFLLTEGTGGAADGLFLCADTGSGGFSWKTVALT